MKVVVDSSLGTEKRYIEEIPTTSDNLLDSSCWSDPNHLIGSKSHNPLRIRPILCVGMERTPEVRNKPPI